MQEKGIFIRIWLIIFSWNEIIVCFTESRHFDCIMIRYYLSRFRPGIVIWRHRHSVSPCTQYGKIITLFRQCNLTVFRDKISGFAPVPQKIFCIALTINKLSVFRRCIKCRNTRDTPLNFMNKFAIGECNKCRNICF